MEQINQGAQNFLNNNGMSVEEAYKHVQTWYSEGKYAEVVDGCQEIMRYVPDYQNISQLLANAQSKLSQAPAKEVSAIPTQQSILEEPRQTAPQVDKPKKNDEDNSAIAQDEKIVSAIGYIGFLCVLPLLLKKDSKYCTFHGKQALTLAIIFFLFKFLGILRDVPVIGGLFKFMLGTVMFLELFIILFSIIQAYRGSMWKIPVVYKMSEQLKF